MINLLKEQLDDFKNIYGSSAKMIRIHVDMYMGSFPRKGPNACILKIAIFVIFQKSEMSSTKCFLRNENRNICHGVVFVISHTFQPKRYISIVRTGNFIMYALLAERIPYIRSEIMTLVDLCL